ncbi:hypothetical protein MJO29_012493 [Puccinia striiformis f. sp. tritici]|nr:hypothetical protein MJO29_012493 [Puccinia striiformis f. sp. tritici]KAI9631101.1 hypothetical protein KEM48_013273 [Puccinia striiformis f. sp. tritici PST-130]
MADASNLAVKFVAPPSGLSLAGVVDPNRVESDTNLTAPSTKTKQPKVRKTSSTKTNRSKAAKTKSKTSVKSNKSIALTQAYREPSWDRMLACQQADTEAKKEQLEEELKDLAQRCPQFAANYFPRDCPSLASPSRSAPQPLTSESQKVNLPLRPNSSPLLPSGILLANTATTAPAPQPSSQPPCRRSSRKSGGGVAA